ncbi:hypothetical protein CYMTET_17019 [Cymbomonas tetramitiformis]|uniref:Uncharacterized protein n=1 Tax=Cymbomonas tetramitiformis TaxID=36881 RepID=A0AAE0GCA4_9CHLO|nr:hypothetical protein CYMTET_17019 [Cymbomonas tetramitiformis]
MAETLTECCELIDEMTMIYSSQEDIEQVKSVVKVQEELFNLYRSRESAVKDAIQDWTKKVSLAEAQASAAEPEGAHETRMKALESIHENVIHTLKVEERKVSEETAFLKRQEQKLQALENSSIPNQRYELSMYAHITQVGWDYEMESMVAGHISNKGTGKESCNKLFLQGGCVGGKLRACLYCRQLRQSSSAHSGCCLYRHD